MCPGTRPPNGTIWLLLRLIRPAILGILIDPAKNQVGFCEEKDHPMSLDPSLKTAGNLTKHRNVLKRHERIERLKDSKGYDPESKQVLHLQKTANRKVR